ncbi:MAG: S1 RNA-binding domain-containing protein, partial [Victivallaceae bacterium]|nr:S1 RNA-binding domain-containing protein [Victivallaceae bacterium]
EQCTELEANSDAAYFAANDRLKLRYLQEMLEHGEAGKLYEGVIAKVSSSGLQVDVAELGIYGFVPREKLGGDLRLDGHRLTSRHGGGYKVGDFIYLALESVDSARGGVMFVPAGR